MIIKSRMGFRLGAAVEYEFMEAMFIESGLYLTTKGARWKETIGCTYLQLPILYSCKYDLGNDVKIGGKVGPCLAAGME